MWCGACFDTTRLWWVETETARLWWVETDELKRRCGILQSRKNRNRYRFYFPTRLRTMLWRKISSAHWQLEIIKNCKGGGNIKTQTNVQMDSSLEIREGIQIFDKFIINVIKKEKYEWREDVLLHDVTSCYISYRNIQYWSHLGHHLGGVELPWSM